MNNDWQEKRIAESQAKKSLRKANDKRQYGNGSIPRFQYKASAIIDLFALYVDEQMILAPNSGKGCRVQTHHIETAFMKFSQEMDRFMLREREMMITLRSTLKEEEE
tara:strand:- start:3627 stop:3947 length:321 start_codon:yes stop_codon:yes gene_type:complete